MSHVFEQGKEITVDEAEGSGKATGDEQNQGCRRDDCIRPHSRDEISY